MLKLHENLVIFPLKFSQDFNGFWFHSEGCLIKLKDVQDKWKMFDKTKGCLILLKDVWYNLKMFDLKDARKWKWFCKTGSDAIMYTVCLQIWSVKTK